MSLTIILKGTEIYSRKVQSYQDSRSLECFHKLAWNVADPRHRILLLSFQQNHHLDQPISYHNLPEIPMNTIWMREILLRARKEWSNGLFGSNRRYNAPSEAEPYWGWVFFLLLGYGRYQNYSQPISLKLLNIHLNSKLLIKYKTMATQNLVNIVINSTFWLTYSHYRW